MGLIDANRALEIVRDQRIAHPNAYHLTNYAMLILREAPTVDAVPVRHGRWENITGGMVILGDCSECKVRQPVIGTNYCKNCGAKMDGGAE